MSNKIPAEIGAIIVGACLDKFDKWAKKHWDFKFEKADMFDEVEEELLDSINYMCLQIIKMRRLKEKLNK